jgi:transcriptional regulator GlxA family with amidase domain
MHGLCAHLLDLSLHDKAEGIERSQRALSVLLDIYAEPSGSPEANHDAGPIENALVYVRGEWAATGMRIVSLDELAAAAGVSIGHLSRLFSATHEYGLVGALELIRLGCAAVELQRTNLTIDSIAQHCGFGNGYHLSRRFAAAYGMPPGRFRRDSAEPDALSPIVNSGLMTIWNALAVSAT